MPAGVQEVLNLMGGAKSDRPHCPDWMPVVARHRSELRGSVFKLVKGERIFYVSLVYALQNPIFGCFVLVRRVDCASQWLAVASWDEDAVDVYGHHFAIDEPHFITSEDRDFWECQYILVLTGVQSLRGGMLAADGDWVQIDVLQTMLEPFASRRSTASDSAHERGTT